MLNVEIDNAEITIRFFKVVNTLDFEKGRFKNEKELDNFINEQIEKNNYNGAQVKIERGDE